MRTEAQITEMRDELAWMSRYGNVPRQIAAEMDACAAVLNWALSTEGEDEAGDGYTIGLLDSIRRSRLDGELA